MKIMGILGTRPQIGHEQIDAGVGTHNIHCLLAAFGRQHLEPVIFEGFGQGGADQEIIFDNQDTLVGHEVRSGFTRRQNKAFRTSRNRMRCGTACFVTGRPCYGYAA
jgi:hypothetical protein